MADLFPPWRVISLGFRSKAAAENNDKEDI